MADKSVVAVALVFVSLFTGLIVYAWMASAGLPTVIAAPIGVFSFLTVLAIFFGITALAIVVVKAIVALLS